MGIYDKLMNFIGIETEPVEENDLLETDEPIAEREPVRERTREAREPAREPASRRREARHEALPQREEQPPMPNVSGMKMIVYHPVSYEDARNIVDNLIAGKPVIVNMEDIEVSSAQRILDFISGAVHAVDGAITRISRGIYAITPKSCAVIDTDNNDYDN